MTKTITQDVGGGFLNQNKRVFFNAIKCKVTSMIYKDIIGIDENFIKENLRKNHTTSQRRIEKVKTKLNLMHLNLRRTISRLTQLLSER